MRLSARVAYEQLTGHAAVQQHGILAAER